MAYHIDDGLRDGDRCFQGPLVIRTGAMSGSLFTSAIGDTVGVHRWHPALPKLAALLAEHGDALAAAVRAIVETAIAFDTLPHVADAYHGKVTIDLADWRAADKGLSDGAIKMARKLAAALGTEESGDGNG